MDTLSVNEERYVSYIMNNMKASTEVEVDVSELDALVADIDSARMQFLLAQIDLKQRQIERGTIDSYKFLISSKRRINESTLKLKAHRAATKKNSNTQYNSFVKNRDELYRKMLKLMALVENFLLEKASVKLTAKTMETKEAIIRDMARNLKELHNCSKSDHASNAGVDSDRLFDIVTRYESRYDPFPEIPDLTKDFDY